MLTQFQKILLAVIVAILFYFILTHIQKYRENFGKNGRQSSYIGEDNEDVFDYYQQHNFQNIQSSTYLIA